MTYETRSLLMSGVLFLLVCAACSSYPKEQLQQAQAAMDEALKHQPEVYATADWRDAQKAWNDAQALLSQQSYGQAAPLLVTAKTRFAKAGQIAKEKREAVLKEVTEAQHDIHV